MSPHPELEQVLARQWNGFSTTLPGGLATALITPKGAYFASPLDGATADSHFRAASTTKTFTAAAVMLLHQRGQLRIDDALTANIPGRTRPYLPATADYAIPHKERITTRRPT